MTKRRRKRLHPNMPKGLSLAEKIEYHSIPEPNSGCKLWMGRVAGSRPYAMILHQGRNWRVARLICKPGPGRETLHKCDVTLCIEETHLYAGTHRDNMQDASRKGRIR
jgi:hypothetical protein